MEPAAAAFGVKLQYLDVENSKDIESVFRAATKGRADAVLVVQSPVFNSQRAQIAELAVKSGSRWHTPDENLSKTAGS